MFIFDFEYSRNVGFIVALTLLIAGFSVYFSTRKFLPRFVRLDILPASGVKTIYKSFFSSLSNKVNLKTYLAYFFTTVSSSLFILNIMLIFRETGSAMEFFVTLTFVLLMALLCYVLLNQFYMTYFKKFFVLGSMAEAIGAAIIIIMSSLVLEGNLSLGALVPAAALLGFSASVRLTVFKKLFFDAVERTVSPRGVIFNLKNIIIFLGAVSAFLVLTLSSPTGRLNDRLITVISMAFALSFIIAVPLVVLINPKKKLTLQYPTEEEEMGLD